MSLSLDATLKTAQDGASHNIVIDMKSHVNESIPFNGEFLTFETTNEQKSNTIMHSTGLLLIIYLFGTAAFKYVYTDSKRSTFNYVMLANSDIGATDKTLIEASICELVNGNIGVIFLCSDGSNFYLRQTILNTEGIIQSSALIDTFAKASFPDAKSPFVVKLADDSYYLVFIKDPTATTSKIFKRTSADFSSWAAEAEIVLNGTTWTIRTSAANNGWLAIACGNGLFVAVAYSGTGNRVMTSPDGITWTIRTSAADNDWHGIAYGNGLFVAVAYSGTGNRVMTSPDGITWTIRTSAADNDWRGIAYGNGLFVAVANSGTGNRVMTSPDGITWTIRTSAADNGWYAIAYGNGLFVAIAYSGIGNRVMTSPDGITWTIRTSAADNAWYGIACGNGLFVAVAISGTGNRVMTSPDGITWTIRTSAADNDWIGIAYGNGLFVAGAISGTGNRVMTSPDGITWTIRTSAADNNWSAIAYGNGLFVAVANSGTGNRVMTSPAGITTNLKTTVSLCQISSDDLFLWLDCATGTNFYNIYYAISADDGATWVAVAVVTSYTLPSSCAYHPFCFQKIADQIYLVFNETNNALHMDEDTTGWIPGHDASLSDMHFDEVSRKLYIVSSNVDAGIRNLYGVIKIDVDTWTIDAYWDEDTTPGFNDMYTDGGPGGINKDRNWGERHYIPIGISNTENQMHITLLDADEDTIIDYNFFDWADHAITKNTTWEPWGYLPTSSWYLDFTHIDFANLRLYACMHRSAWYLAGQLEIGYFSITDEGPVYTWHPVVRYRDENNFSEMDALRIEHGHFKPQLIDNWMIVSSFQNITHYKGKLYIFDTTEEYWYWEYAEDYHTSGRADKKIAPGKLLKCYNIDDYPSFPYHGIDKFVVIEHKLYGCFGYEGDYAQSERRGLVEIDLDTDEIIYHRPDYAEIDDYAFRGMDLTDDNKIIIATWGYGMVIYNPADNSWKQLNNANVPNLTETSGDIFAIITYDNANDMIFGGAYSSYDWRGLVGVLVDGYLQKARYKIGTLNGSWAFGSTANFCVHTTDYDAVIALHPDNQTIYAFFTNDTNQAYSLKWDQEITDFDLIPFLVTAQDLVIEKTIENIPNRLSFKLADGQLFDETNIRSIYRTFLTKGMDIVLKIGEKVGGTDYWQEMGTFIVREKDIDYERGKLPQMSVTCENISSLWRDMGLRTSAYYNGSYPETILSSILQTKAGLGAGQINISNFDNRTSLYLQWIQEDILLILDTICTRYGYYYRMNVDNEFECKKISDSNAIDHTYADSDTIMKYISGDKYSNFVNTVKVVGESREFMPKTYEEKALNTKNGTAGWFTGKETIRIPYSEDLSLQCIHPRPIWHTQISGMFGWAGKVTWKITEDTNQRYCDLVITGPNLADLLAAEIALIAVTWAIPDGVALWGTIPIGRIAEGVALITMLNMLCAITNWQVTIYGKPVGYIRKSVQAISIDTAYKDLIGKTIEQTITEPLAYTIPECQEVADQEVMVSRLQRKGITVHKIGHLQDEDGDTLSFIHPYSQDVVKMFVTRMTRRIKKPSKTGTTGGMFDELEGWRIK